MKAQLVLLLCCALASWFLTRIVCALAVRHDLLDVPNQRSSHSRPTPRGGGLAIAAVFIGAVVFLASTGRFSPRLACALAGGGLLIAAVGIIDDRRGLSSRVRATAHLAASTWAVAWIGGMAEVQVGDVAVDLSYIGSALAVLVIVWMTNLYNFMDGIDGIAAGVAVVGGAAAAYAASLAGAHDVSTGAAILAAASAGFMFWNWAPARIFMGDVGSGLLGYSFGVLAIASEAREGPALTLWVLIFGAFIFDATVTLARRVRRGERWYDAHRSHAYQRAVQAGSSHAQVTSITLALTAGLSALSIAVVRGWVNWWAACLFGVSVLTLAYLAVERRKPMERV